MHRQKHVFLENVFFSQPPGGLTIEIFKKHKNLLEISWFYISVPEIMIIWGLIVLIWLRTNSYNILGQFLKKINFSKNKKGTQDQCNKIITCLVAELRLRGQTDGSFWANFSFYTSGDLKIKGSFHYKNIFCHKVAPDV